MVREPVSADSSVLIVLAKAGRLYVLEGVFERVLVEDAVAAECLVGVAGRADARAIEAALAKGTLTTSAAHAPTSPAPK
jgi:predicted nucleic acid-binding protein